VWKNGRSESSSRLFLAQTDRKLTISLRMIHSRTREIHKLIRTALTADTISHYDEDRVPVAQNSSDINSYAQERSRMRRLEDQLGCRDGSRGVGSQVDDE